MADTLQGPTDGHQGAARGHPAGQCPQILGRQPADGRRPRRLLGHTVVGTEQIALEPLVPGAVGVQERPVGQALGGQHMGQRQHDRDIGARNRGVPLVIAVDIVAQRRELHDVPAALAQPLQCPARRMCGGATMIDTGVLQRDTAERDHQVGVLDDHLPLRGAFEQIVMGADHAGHDHAGRPEAVGMPRGGVSADEFEEPVHLTLGVVEPPGAGPAIGAAVDGLVAVGIDHPAQLCGQQLGQLIPGHRDELVGTALPAGAGPVAQPAAAHRGTGHPGAVPDGTDAVLFLLGDQPLVTPETINRLLSAYRESAAPIVLPLFKGMRGNPVLFSRETFQQLELLDLDSGARPLFEEYAGRILQLPVDDGSIHFDIDTEEDYRRLIELDL